MTPDKDNNLPPDNIKDKVLTVSDIPYTFTIYYNADTLNYEYEEVKLTITIVKKEVSVVWTGIDKTFNYNGSEQKTGISATYDGNAMTVTFTNNADVDEKVKYSFENAGTYILTATPDAETLAENYTISGATTGVTINKAVISIAQETFTYDYSKSGYTIIPEVYYGENKYTLSESGTNTTLDQMGLHIEDLVYSGTGVDGHKFTDGGTYTVTVSISEDEPNWTVDSSNKTFTIKINSVYIGTIIESSSILSDKTYTFKSDGSGLTTIEEAANKTSGCIQVAFNTRLNNSVRINEDVTLLIPYDSSNDAATQPTTTDSSGIGEAHSTLTIAAGEIMLTVNGTLNVSAQQKGISGADTHNNSNYDNMHIVGNYGKMLIGSEASVIINGTLYCFGYIDGSGDVVVNPEANVYEPLDVDDWPGGSVALELNNNNIFPFNKFNLANIKAKMTIYNGATVYAYYFFKIKYVLERHTKGKIRLFGDSDESLFQITSGSVSKEVSNGKTIITANRGSNVNTNDIEVSVMGYTISTKTSQIPICEWYELVISEKATITLNSKFKLLDGASFTLEKDATCSIGSNGGLMTSAGDYISPTAGNTYYADGKPKALN